MDGGESGLTPRLSRLWDDGLATFVIGCGPVAPVLRDCSIPKLTRSGPASAPSDAQPKATLLSPHALTRAPEATE